ncbi:MAG: amino acid ABC transporter permease [Deltaproteobacteria bacterium]|nr:amino acid ABC transporter permease [Deltaproteobacteria bacterium]
MGNVISEMLFIGQGLLVTLELLFGGLGIGITFGVLFSILRYKGIASILIQRLISLLRGTPLILQLSIVYFSTPAFLGFKLSILSAGILTFGLNSSAYIAEILRSGIENLNKGQFEAAKALDIPTFYMWKDIVLPQVLKNILPAMQSEVIALLKETALISTIGGLDVMRSAQMVSAEKFTYFLPLCIAGAYYYSLVLLIETLGKNLERRGSYA